jgi:hypothetical protein
MKNFMILILTLWSLLILSSFSQSLTSDIHGKIILGDGSAVPGVSITLTGDMQKEKNVISTDEGSFIFTGLKPGNYCLKFERKGFSSVFRDGIRLLGNKSVRLDIQMIHSPLYKKDFVTETDLLRKDAKLMWNSDLVPSKKITQIAAGERYRASGLHQFLFGRDYRQLWVESIKAEILDMESEAGGLTPLMAVGGHQTLGLALKGEDGRSYTFRGIDKDPTATLPPELEGTIADRVVQDQISSSHPAAPLVAEPLMEAAGVLCTKVRFVVMPDDPSLGEFRDEFAGVFGTFQEYPTPISDTSPGFADATEILSHLEMWKRLEATPDDRVDSRAFLRARLLDLLIGDWDRHRKQWRWAKIPGKLKWQPIPEDRDQAFCRYDGLFISIARPSLPFIVNFGNKYPRMDGLTYASRDADRYLLTDLKKSDWESIAIDLKSRLTDSVIEAAVKHLPPEYYRLDGSRLEATLKVRRNHLLAAADRFYKLLARRVNIQMTDQAELAEIVRVDGNTTDIRVSLRPSEKGDIQPEPYYHRRFYRNETQEIRVYLRGGDDFVVTRGGPHKNIKIRIIGGPGDDFVDDSEGGGLRIYDSKGSLKIIPGPGTKFDAREYIPPSIPSAPWIPPRDWGKQIIPLPWVGYGPDTGLFLGCGFTTKFFGFRKNPYSSEHTLRAGFAFEAKAPRLDYQGEFRRENSAAYTSVSASATGIKIFRFYGFGNETTSREDDDFYKVRQRQISLDFSFNLPVAGPLFFNVGPVIKYSRTDLDQNSLISAIRPYGTENFGQIGVKGKLVYDTRNIISAPTSGALIFLEGKYFPGIWDVKSGFGYLHIQSSTYLTLSSISLQPTLAIRMGGERVFGEYPFHEAAFIGGGGLAHSGSTVRGLYAQRYAGDSAIYGNAELRFRVRDIYLFFPGEIGLFILGDVGRVYFHGENSKMWHSAIGGGVWLSFLGRKNTFSISLAKSDERLGLYVSGGFSF